MWKGLMLISLVALLHDVGSVKITVEQMNQASEPVRMVCIGKTKVTDEALANMHAGKLEEDGKLKCYVYCVMEMMQMVRTFLFIIYVRASKFLPNFFLQMKKGKLMYDAVVKSIDTMMPDELRVDTKRALETCKGVAVGIKDNCEAAFVLLKCLYKENPDFFFP